MGKKFKPLVPTTKKQVKSMLTAHHIKNPSKGTIKSFKRLGKLKAKHLKRTHKKQNAIFEGPNKTSGIDKRKAINRERRSV